MKALQFRMWMTLGVAAVALGAVLPAGRMRAAQQAPVSNMPYGRPTQPQMPAVGDATPDGDEARVREQQRTRALADDREKHLQADTARLVQLSTELKDEVDKSGKFVTSVTAIRKAEEIEKLAHSVRDRMKN